MSTRKLNLVILRCLDCPYCYADFDAFNTTIWYCSNKKFKIPRDNARIGPPPNNCPLEKVDEAQ